jgi:hypothetical protein
VYTAENVKKLMQATGYRTQGELAEAVDVSVRTVRRWCKNGTEASRAVAKLDALAPRLAFKKKFADYQAGRAQASPVPTPASDASL